MQIELPEALFLYAIQFVGKPYRYGGKCPLNGLDCSGLVEELLSAAGVIPFGFVMNAQGLYQHFLNSGAGQGFGGLAFFGKALDQIDHVGFCLTETHMIEAGGGHADCLTLDKAIEQNAFVKVRPIHYRKDFLTVLMPKYPWI